MIFYYELFICPLHILYNILASSPRIHLVLSNVRDPLRGVHGDPPGIRRAPGSMRRKGVITRRGSCRGSLLRKRKVYARGILVDPGPDPLDAWCLECFLFLFTRGWILVDPDVNEEVPVQWITGIKHFMVNIGRVKEVHWVDCKFS